MFFRENYLLFILAVFTGTFCLNYYLIPKVLWVSKEKNLTAPVNNRSSHKVETPSFGGVAFYITLILFLALLQSMRLSIVGAHLIAAVSILFMVGLKDDLVVSTARVKLFGQITASFFIIFAPQMQLTNLHGFLGIFEIPEFAGYILNTLIFIGLINAYNLIDGIDGLASMVGIFIFMVFGVLFYNLKEPFYVLLSACAAGILAGFLRYNFSRGERKMFMGDSGSLVIGYLIAFLSIRYLNIAPEVTSSLNGFQASNRLLFLGCLLFIPVFDTFRVFAMRLLQGKSPFEPDRNHLHHVLVDNGHTHLQSGIILVLLNLFVISTYVFFAGKLSHAWLIALVAIIYLSFSFIFMLLKKNNKKLTLNVFRESFES